MCTNLQIEGSKLTTEVEIERTTIDETQRREETTLVEETQEVLRQKQEKTVTTTKVTEINKAKLKEQETSRITKETEERISLIKSKIETERIEQTKITEQTTSIEHQVTNIQHQVEIVENSLVQEILHEKEESFEADEVTDTIATEAEEELTTLIEKKKTTLEEEKSKTTTKIESLTTKTTDLESTIESTTKTITEVTSKIDTLTSTTTSLIQQKEHLKQQIKIVSITDQSKIQEDIDRITTTIIDNRKEIETYVTTREEAVTEETVTRTELTYTSQNLKKYETLEEHIEEQITVSEVVISSKKEDVIESKEKTTIIESQISCFKKKQSLSAKIEEVRQYKSNVNYKISKKTKFREEAELQLQTTKGES